MFGLFKSAVVLLVAAGMRVSDANNAVVATPAQRVIAVWCAHHDAVRSIQWTTQMQSDPLAGRPQLLSSDETAAADDAGRWFASTAYVFATPEGERTSSDGQFYFDGRRLVGVTERIRQGIIRPKDPSGEFGTEMALRGPTLDIGLPLPHAMRESRELRIVDRSWERGSITVEALVHAGWDVRTIRCELLIARGLVPRRIEYRNAIWGAIERSLEVTAFDEVEGHSIPVEGRTCEYEPDWSMPGVRAGVDWVLAGMMSVSVNGRVDALDERQRDVGRQRAVVAFGADGPPVRKRGNEIRIRHPRVWGVNQPFPMEKATFVFPEGWDHVNAFEDTDAKGKPLYDPNEDIGAVGDVPLAAADREQEAVEGFLNVLPLDPQDAGRVVVGSVVKRRFQLTNKSSTPVAISVVKKSCACTDVKVESQTLAVGESSSVVMESIAPGIGQQQRLGAVLQAVRQGGPVGAAGAPSEVLLDMMFTPEIAFDLLRERAEFRCVAGEEWSDDLRVIQRTAGVLRIEKIECSIPEIRVGEPRISPANPSVHVIDLAARVERPGRYVGVVNWHLPDTQLSVVQTRVALVVLPKVFAEPAALIIERSESTEVRHVAVRVAARTDRVPVRIAASVEPPVEGVSLATPHQDGQFVVGQAEGANVVVRIDPTKLQGVFAGTSIVLREAGGEVQLEIPILWTDRPI